MSDETKSTETSTPMRRELAALLAERGFAVRPESLGATWVEDTLLFLVDGATPPPDLGAALAEVGPRVALAAVASGPPASAGISLAEAPHLRIGTSYVVDALKYLVRGDVSTAMRSLDHAVHHLRKHMEATRG